MAKSVRISLANKCQLLFGTAVVLILSVALTVGGLRMQTLVDEGQQVIARELSNAWLADMIQLGGALVAETSSETTERDGHGLVMSLVAKGKFTELGGRDPFLAEAVAQFKTRPELNEWFLTTHDDQGPNRYLYARAIRASDKKRLHGDVTGLTEAVPKTDPLEMVLLIQLRTDLARRQLALNRLYLIAAGLLAGLLAIGVFWFITRRIILSPIRVLRDTAAKVSEGDLNIRSDINTGDEFEQLSDMFNTMLENLNKNQEKLRGINKSLDLKLGELAEHNVSLYEANVVKGKFLANVSHELRTPLNSITGFAEVLGESLKDGKDPTDDKRRRYVQNIITSSRQLLDLINDLLDLAKIEAGRMEIRVTPMSVADCAEGLMNLIRPQAEKRGIGLELLLDRSVPVVATDAGKFQQIVFNFLSNAIKFTPPGGTVTLTTGMDQPSSGNGGTDDKDKLVRISVSDTGPGIALDRHEMIFEKFTQLDSTETREHGGTGLGLAISQELAGLLRGRIELDSDTGRGATFSLIIPVTLEPDGVPKTTGVGGEAN